MIKILITTLLVWFQFISIYSQNKTDSIGIAYFNKLIPYDSLKAWQDIRASRIQILDLMGVGHSGEPINSVEEIEFVERRFGFKFRRDFIKAPYNLVVKKQEEYNNQVYKYLDSVLHIDSKKEINIELKRLALERLVLVNESDKQLEKRVKKTFRKESVEFKSMLISADKKYRSRKFKEALCEYVKLHELVKTASGLQYLQISEYHCKMNLGEYAEAIEMYNSNNYINRVSKRIKN